MTSNRKLAALALAGLLASTSLISVSTAYAAQMNAAQTKSATSDAVTKATAASTDKNAQIIKTVDDAYRAMREIRGSRIAIFNGTPELATKLVGDAIKDLEAANQKADGFSVPTKKSASNGDYLPFDTSMSLAEGFVPTAEKAAKLKEANAHIANGEHKKAADTLKLANIDVSIATALLPATSSLASAKDAAKLLGEKKYYEANLALKSIEDGVVVESYGIDSVPKQGKNG